MLVIVGYLVILGAVFGGFAIGGGHLGSLLQPVELLMIGGAVLDKARRILSEDGLAAALEDILMAAAIFNGGLGCILVGFFSGATS